LGNPYQLYWNDEGDSRGFHIFDTETFDIEFVENPHTMFHKICYNEEEPKLINPNPYKGTYIKLIAEKSTPTKLGRLVDKLYDAGVHDLKIIENIDISLEEDAEIEAEDTLTTLTNYVNALEDINKDNIINIFKSLYVEAQEV
jgi:hypothetical protein